MDKNLGKSGYKSARFTAFDAPEIKADKEFVLKQKEEIIGFAHSELNKYLLDALLKEIESAKVLLLKANDFETVRFLQGKVNGLKYWADKLKALLSYVPKA